MRQAAVVVISGPRQRAIFGGISLAFRGLTPAWLGRFSLLGLPVSGKISWLIAVIAVSLNLLLKSP
jgi:hypothetical protein